MTNTPDDSPMLVFQSSISRGKPITIRSASPSENCPFCDYSQLPSIARQDGDILLTPNKYPILKNSDPYVLIETGECESELSLYTEDRLLRVFRMGFSVWREMEASGAYRSVLFLKNHGSMSGGTLRHPHMQLIGLYDVDCLRFIRREHFSGPVAERLPGAELNLSDHPLVGFTEFNLILHNEDAFSDFCLLIQQTVRYVMRRFHGGAIGSCNLFFYCLEGVTYCKVMPRAVTTPVFIGYTIPQVTDDLAAIAADLHDFLHRK